MVDVINLTLHEEMRRNPRIMVFGEDVADCSREANLARGERQRRRFQSHRRACKSSSAADRCFNTPLAEAAIVGRAIGHGDARAEAGGGDSVLRLHLAGHDADARRTGHAALALATTAFSAPVVMRVAIGGYLNGGAIYHSQCGEVIFTHIPGLRVVMPSNALDACGLLRTAIRCDDPVLFLEHKKLYREPYNRSPHPGPDYTIPFGKAKVVKPGAEPDRDHLRRAGAEDRCRRRCRWSSATRTRPSK